MATRSGSTSETLARFGMTVAFISLEERAASRERRHGRAATTVTGKEGGGGGCICRSRRKREEEKIEREGLGKKGREICHISPKKLKKERRNLANSLKNLISLNLVSKLNAMF